LRDSGIGPFPQELEQSTAGRGNAGTKILPMTMKRLGRETNREHVADAALSPKRRIECAGPHPFLLPGHAVNQDME
jgi:hypothetical protein